MRPVVFLLFLTLPAFAAPARTAIVFGGNCEASSQGPNRVNQFLYYMQGLSSSLREKGWDVNPIYDGDTGRCTIADSDPRCQDKKSMDPPKRAQCCDAGVIQTGWSADYLATASGKSFVPKATKENLLAALSDAEKLPPGSQLMLNINTHGGPANKGLAHDICLSGEEFMPVDDPQFLAVLDRLKAKGVKIAITDESCFSGGSIPVLQKYGCVMSGQSENRVGYGNPLTISIQDILKASQRASLADAFENTLNHPEKGLNIQFGQTFGSGLEAGDERLNLTSPEISGMGTDDLNLAELASRFFVQSGLPYDATYWHNKYDGEHSCRESVRAGDEDFSAQLENLTHLVVSEILPRLGANSVGNTFKGYGEPGAARDLANHYFRAKEKLAADNAEYAALIKNQMSATPALLPLAGFSAAEQESLSSSLMGMAFAAVGNADKDHKALPLLPLTEYDWGKEGNSFSDFVRQQAEQIALKMLTQMGGDSEEARASLAARLRPALQAGYEKTYLERRSEWPRMKELPAEILRLGDEITKGRHDVQELYTSGRAAKFKGARQDLREAREKGSLLTPEQAHLSSCEDFSLN